MIDAALYQALSIFNVGDVFFGSEDKHMSCAVHVIDAYVLYWSGANVLKLNDSNLCSKR